ncbi:MAG TPA: HAMP domain-containing sensor histidine kinase [Nitrososphaera sp.]|nr:HAMP domain-containing sensor histidine kinase [Nitrososphaera sp.]
MTLLGEEAKLEVWTGLEQVIEKSLYIMNRIKNNYDLCTDTPGLLLITTVESIRNAFFAMHKRGVKMRLITEMTRENLPAVKEAMKFAEVRHLDKTIGNFVIADGTDYAGVPDVANGVQQLLVCNIGSFVRQQTYLFETLWQKALPAHQRIRQFEGGAEPETLELIPDVEKSINQAFSVINETRSELLFLFATARTFHLAMSTEALDLYRKVTERGVNMRILVPTGDNIAEAVSKVRSRAPRVTIQVSNANLNTRLTIMVSDKSKFISWELKDDTLDDPFKAGGPATYSSIKSLASSYATIIENLWLMSSYAQELQEANTRLERSENVMKEFLNIAAHEMRTPLQPILGLSQNIVDTVPQITGDTRDALEAISRNAKRLQLIVEDLLDVTRIEGRMLKLSKQRVNLDEILREAVQHDFRPRCEQKKVKLTLKSEPNLYVMADKGRIIQVISNLLSNSLGFTGIGGQITIRAQATSYQSSKAADPPPAVQVSVTDDGKGIEPGLFPMLFNKFVTGSEWGHGLGLYICKGIIEAHGGTIRAENNKDRKGANFSFLIPVKSE